MGFTYTYEQAQCQRIADYKARSAARVLLADIPAALADTTRDGKYIHTPAPDWMVERIVRHCYEAAPQLRGALPRQWCQELSMVAIQDTLNTVHFDFSPVLIPRGAPSMGFQSLFTEDELRPFGLFSETTGTYAEFQQTMQPLANFVRSLHRCVPIVALQRHPWMLEHFPRGVLRSLTDGYTDQILDHYMTEFNALPQRKDVVHKPDASLEPALQLLNLYKLKEH